MSDLPAVIFGAGKIARGFIAHLLTLSGYSFTFVEQNVALAAALSERGRYRVRIMGAPEKTIEISCFRVLTTEDLEEVARAIGAASIVFVSVGGPNLPGVAGLLARGIECCAARRREAPLNVVLCENYFEPAAWSSGLLAARLNPDAEAWRRHNVGIVETMVLRSVVEPDGELRAQDPLALSAQDMWEMPADGEAFRGEVPSIVGLKPQAGFRKSLIRKLFTYNSINAVIAYTGYLRRYELLSEAANDPQLAALARAASGESGPAICARYGFALDEQRRFAESAIAKYQNRAIVDPIERNTRDPLRKLARNDRLAGPACLAFESGRVPEALARAIAAALHYDHEGDSSACRLQQMIQGKGVAETIREVCGIDPDQPLGASILRAYPDWKRVP